MPQQASDKWRRAGRAERDGERGILDGGKVPSQGGGNTAAGVNAVKAELVREFGAINIEEGFDVNTQEALLDFKADGLDYRVRVSREYDDDYASGQLRVDLRGLGATLRASNNGRARVMRTGVISH